MEKRDIWNEENKQEEKEKEELIIEDDTVYEIDLECWKRKIGKEKDTRSDFG